MSAESDTLTPLPSSNPPPPATPEASGLRAVPRLDDTFNFKTVVFQVENTIFQVLKNGFNVPGTVFEAMFALPGAESEYGALEGESLENPILLEGIKVGHFRAFLRVLYPFIIQSAAAEYDVYGDWIGVLDLATLWEFKEMRTRAITALSELIKQKTVPEKISLARKYRIKGWLREGLIELVQKKPLTLEELSEAPLCPLDWETIARVCYIKTQITSETYCDNCGNYYGSSYSDSACKCPTNSYFTLVDQVFRTEMECLDENLNQVNPPLPGQVPASPVKKKGKKKKPVAPQ